MNIQPVSTYYNGQIVQLKQLQVASVYDNLDNEATFYYQLLTDTDVRVTDGNLIMNGQDYIDWGNSNDINLAAYQWCANKLNLILI